jgi:hypothetical protein
MSRFAQDAPARGADLELVAKVTEGEGGIYY